MGNNNTTQYVTFGYIRPKFGLVEDTNSTLPPIINAYELYSLVGSEKPTFPQDCKTFLLRREIPMAWGTTTDRLTPEINPFQYAREIKHLTLKDQTVYLILDG